MLSLCCFVDPHFKKRLSEEDRLATISIVKKELLGMEEARNCEEPAIATQEPSCKISAFSRILGDDIEELPTKRSVLDIVKEVDSYLQMPVADIDQSPLELWRREELRFPLLNKLARKL